MWYLLLFLVVILVVLIIWYKSRWNFKISNNAMQEFHEYVMYHPERVQYGKDCCNLDLTDPTQTEKYFRIELLEPEHADIVSQIKSNQNVFSSAMMRKWIHEEELEKKVN